MTKYYIPAHVYFASDADTVVFLDLRADRYSMLFGEKAHAFNALLSNANAAGPRVLSVNAHACLGDPTLYHQVLSELVDNRLATLDTRLADVALPAQPIPPEDSLFTAMPQSQTSLSIIDVWHFLAACTVSKLRLKFLKIETVVRHVDRRKELNRSAEHTSISEVHRLVTIYNRLRPIIPSSHLCLFDSLCLLEFLACYGCFPSWVFAVRFDPWGAHCWVQYGTLALNEDIEVASAHLPIMTV